jgi:hypothetical protein
MPLLPDIAPEAGDVVLVRTNENPPCYTLSTSPEPPQIAYSTYDEALARAVRFARSRSVNVWRSEGSSLARVAISSSLKDMPMRTSTSTSTDDMLHRVRGEFFEMPGLRLTDSQAQRLWGLDPSTCSALLTALVDAGYLFRTADGSVMKNDRSRPTK